MAWATLRATIPTIPNQRTSSLTISPDDVSQSIQIAASPSTSATALAVSPIKPTTRTGRPTTARWQRAVRLATAMTRVVSIVLPWVTPKSPPSRVMMPTTAVNDSDATIRMIAVRRAPRRRLERAGAGVGAAVGARCGSVMQLPCPRSA